MKFSPQSPHAAVVAVLAVIFAPVSSALTVSDNFTDPANWGSPITEAGGNLSVGSGRMNYTASSTGNSFAATLRNAPLLPTTQDWSLKVDAHLNPFTLTTDGQFSDVFLGFGKTGDWINTHVTFEFGRGYWGNPAHNGYYVQDDTRINGSGAPTLFSNWNVTSPDLALRMDYSAASHTLTYYFDSDGATGGYNWVAQGSANLASGTYNLNMGPADTFTVLLVGSSAGQTVAASQAYLSNLEITVNQSPIVTTGAASGITATTGILNGTVNPTGLAATARFEYGLTTAYGNTAVVMLTPDNGTTAQNVSANLSNLLPGQIYHYRLTATNSSGMVPGVDMIFTTAVTSSPVSTWLVINGFSVNTDLRSDPNGDGVNLLTAYALNLDPKLNLSGRTPTPVIGGSQMSISYYAGNADVIYISETSTDLQTWSMEGVSVSGLDANKFRTATVPVSGPSRFMRLRFTALSTLTDEQQIQALYAEMLRWVSAHDETGFLALFAPDYLHQGQNLADQFEGPGFLDNVETFAFDSSGITFLGNEARVAGTVTLKFNNGDPAETWLEPDTASNGGLGWLRKTPDGWRVVGDQKRASVSVQTAHSTTPGDDRYYFQMRAESSLPIAGGSVSGPGIVTTELVPDLEWGGFEAFVGDFNSANCPPVGTVYTFVVRYPDGSQETYQDTVKAWVATGPVVSVTTDAGNSTIHWTDVSVAVANVDHYWVFVRGTDVYWKSDDLPLTQNSIAFNADGTSNAPLVAGQSYRAHVFIFDSSDNYAAMYYDFTMPLPPAPDGFAPIPAGPFEMGDQSNPLVGNSNELPVHSVYVSAFYMGKYEVTNELWEGVRAWGLNNGYTDLPMGNGAYASKGANHPVHSITWYAMVKWCNARSQKEGLTPCYTASGVAYRTGSRDAVVCNWSANGYRLPTEAEWEKAARGGVSGKNFPWGTDTISHVQANYNVYSSDGTTNYYSYDVTPRPPATGNYYYHPSYTAGGYHYTAPVDSFTPNGYGLFNMSGNVWEWCWDWYESYPAGSQADPRGAPTGSFRVLRGGGWGGHATDCRVAHRDFSYPTNDGYNYSLGFRLVRSSLP